MKRLGIKLLGGLCLIFSMLVAFSVSYAEETSKNNSIVGIKFDDISSIGNEDMDKAPLIEGGSNKPPIRMLPQTGELLSSLIVILSGISFLIFTMGVYSIKQLYQQASWEV